MPSNRRAVDCLADIVDNIERVERHVTGLSWDVFARNELVMDAVERCLERVCEAGIRLGEQARELMPDQPWGEIRGMGNQLRHAYHQIDSKIIWGVVERRLPGLKEAARDALTRLECDERDS